MENELTLEQYRHNYTMITDATFVEVCNFYISVIRIDGTYEYLLSC